MNKKWILFLLVAIVFYPAFLHAEEDKAPAATAAAANAATDKALDAAAGKADDFALEDEDAAADEDLALDEDLEEAPDAAAPAAADKGEKI